MGKTKVVDDKTPVCPRCESLHVVPIVYGFPDRELLEKAKREEAVLGGCFVTSEQPQWRCRNCGNEWRTAESTTRL